MSIFGHKVGAYVFFSGLIGVLFTMFSWWSDVINEAEVKGDQFAKALDKPVRGTPVEDIIGQDRDRG